MTSSSGVARVGDIDVAYDTRGAGEPMLLVAGFGMTRAMWDDDLCDVLARHGFQVVRMDNRDSGASTRMNQLGVPDVPRLFVRSLLGRPVVPPYTLEDMATDAVQLMASLGHARFHVVGASMGGMIAQTIALDQPEHLLSLTSIMSTPGGRRYSFAGVRGLGAILRRIPKEPEAQLEHFVRILRIIGGDRMPFEEALARRIAAALVLAKPSSSGSARQFAAILDSGARRRPRLPSIKTPTLVIHGSRDPLLPVRGSQAMARLIPGAELLVVEGMGHWIPTSHYESLSGVITRHAKKVAKAA